MHQVRDTRVFVLVADPEPAILRFLSWGLAFHRYCVLPAASLLDAVELFRSRMDVIDLALVDQAPPLLDGAATLRALLQLKPTLRCAVMGSTVMHDKARLLAAGAACLLPKPFGMTDAVWCLRNLHKEVLAASTPWR